MCVNSVELKNKKIRKGNIIRIIRDCISFFLLYIGVCENKEVKKMKIYSETTQREYNDEDMVFFRNIQQSIFYISHGAVIYDLFIDSQGKIVFCFSKKDHNTLKVLWGSKEDNSVNN